LIQLGMFGAAGVGFSLIAELRAGVVERFRVTPVSRLALLLGRAFRDILMLLMQATILIVLSLPFGLNIHFTGVLVVLALVGLLGLLMASISYACALWLKSEDSFAPLIFTATLPLLLLSGVLLPLTLAPGWLRAIAAANPLSYAVDAARAVFNDHLGDVSVEKGVLITAVLASSRSRSRSGRSAEPSPRWPKAWTARLGAAPRWLRPRPGTGGSAYSRRILTMSPAHGRGFHGPDRR
ncbi:MAG: ABC transporter permease, partial [Candidatus Dormibacteraeota bacterium]|nr:ABC transporter permease [Candidatus Dormibacteraeota bacterium]